MVLPSPRSDATVTGTTASAADVDRESTEMSPSHASAGRKRRQDEVVADDLMRELLNLCSGDLDRMEAAVNGMMNDDRFRPILERWMGRAAKEFASKEVPSASSTANDEAQSAGSNSDCAVQSAVNETTVDGPTSRAKKRRRNLVDSAKAPDLSNGAYQREGRSKGS